MRVGITYDLKEDYVSSGLSDEEAAEFDHPATIEAIESTLRDLGFETDRIGNLNRLLDRLAHGQRWDLVFNIAEGLRGIGREAQVPALLDAFEIPYTFSDPLVLSLTLHKGMTKHVVRDLGIPTPDFYCGGDRGPDRENRPPLPAFRKAGGRRDGEGHRRHIGDPNGKRAHDGLSEPAQEIQTAGIGGTVSAGAGIHGRHPGLGRERQRPSGSWRSI